MYCLIDDAAKILANWREAFPDGLRRRREEFPVAANMYWLRLLPGEQPARVVSSLVPSPALPAPFVILADEPGESLVMQALEAGAAGCCNTHAAPEVLRQVAVVVENGGLWVGRTLMQHVLASTQRILAQKESLSEPDWASLLSERELAVARLVAQGASNKEVARRLDIVERTVKAHLTAIFEKLQVRDRLQLSLRINGVRA